MTTAATIDIDTLNNLFDNQKKLDDIFSSIFDEDSFLDSPAPSSKTVHNSTQSKSQDIYSNQEYLFEDDNSFTPNKRSMTSFAMPVLLEIAIIYYGMTYLL